MNSEGSLGRINTHSLLPLQMLIYFSFHYTPFFFIINLALYVYKAVTYYYPGRILGWELTTLFLFLFIDGVRLLLGMSACALPRGCINNNVASKGNKTSTSNPLISSLVLSIPMIILHSYYISLQTYILRVDVVLNAIAFFFLGSEIILSVMVLVNIISESRKF